MIETYNFHAIFKKQIVGMFICKWCTKKLIERMEILGYSHLQKKTLDLGVLPIEISIFEVLTLKL